MRLFQGTGTGLCFCSQRGFVCFLHLLAHVARGSRAALRSRGVGETKKGAISEKAQSGEATPEDLWEC